MNGATLRQQRQAVGVKASTVAARMGRHPSNVTRLEQSGDVGAEIATKYLTALSAEVAALKERRRRASEELLKVTLSALDLDLPA